jgi:hypothetical protein
VLLRNCFHFYDSPAVITVAVCIVQAVGVVLQASNISAITVLHTAAMQRAELHYCSSSGYSFALSSTDTLYIPTAQHCITELEPATTTASIAAKGLRQALRT